MADFRATLLMFAYKDIETVRLKLAASDICLPMQTFLYRLSELATINPGRPSTAY